MGKNAIVGQSGGPTSVINASLAGVFESCKNRGAEIVYGMCNGVAGLLEERVVDLSTILKDDLDIELLKRTPSSFLGSCRYKLPDWHADEAVYKKLFDILEKLDIGYFFYIGGNDSMDTIGKLADYGARTGSDIRFMGVPKTIDNDLMVTDHTPGYGSAAKYIGVVMKEIIRDATVYGTKYVTIVEIMGRNAGWLTAAAALAKGDDCEGVDMICLPEVPFHVDRFIEKVRAMQEKKPSIVIAVSEGVKLEDGRYVCELRAGRRRPRGGRFRPQGPDRHRPLPGQHGGPLSGHQDPLHRAFHPAALRRPSDQPHRHHRGIPGGRRCRQGRL